MFNLIEQLEKYKYFDKNEEKSVNDTMIFLRQSTNCFDRSNLKGHITAGGFVCDNRGNILLNHHKQSGMWFQFGGHSDGECDSLSVAKREIMEETGLTNVSLAINGIFDVAVITIPYNAKRNEPEHLHYDVNYIFYTNNKNFEISNESTEIKWVSIEEAKKLINPQDIGMIRMIEKYEKLLEKKICKNI